MSNEPGSSRKRSRAACDFPEAAGPEISRFKFPLYGRREDLLLGFAGQLRSQLGPHLFEFLALAGLEDLANPAQARGAEVVELILEAFVIVAVVLKNDRDLVRLFRRKIQLGLKILKDGIVTGFPDEGSGGNDTMQTVVETILHSQHADSSSSQENEQQRRSDARVPKGRFIAHGM